MWDDILELFGGLSYAQSDPRSKAAHAYKAAWKSRVQSGNDSESILTEALKQHSVPGAYSDPDTSPLTFLFEAWRAGSTPPDVRKQVRQRLRTGTWQ